MSKKSRSTVAESQSPAPPDAPPETSPDDSTHENERTGNIEEVEDFRDVNSLDSVISDYIAKENLEDGEYRASLFKYDKVNKQKQVLVDTSIGTILSAHDIGMAMGSGEYRYLVVWPKRKKADGTSFIKAFRINIGESYDIKRAMSGSPMPAGMPVSQPPPGNPVEMALQLIAGMTTLSKMNAPPAPTPQDTSLAMAQSHTAMQQLLMQSSMQYVEFMREMRKRMLAIDSEQYQEDEEDMDEGNDELVKTVKELAITFLPKLLGNGPGAKLAAAAVRATPQFKRIQRDPVTAAHLLSELEKDFGKEKVDAVCERLKIKRP